MGIRMKIVKQGKRSAMSQPIRSRDDEEAIATWRSDLDRILHIFNVRLIGFVQQSLTTSLQTELGINTHTTVADIHRAALTGQEGIGHQHCSVSTTLRLSITGY